MCELTQLWLRSTGWFIHAEFNNNSVKIQAIYDAKQPGGKK